MSFLWTEVFLESAKNSFEYFCYETGPYQISHMWTFLIYPARTRSTRARRACALRALGLLLADGATTVGRGRLFDRSAGFFYGKKLDFGPQNGQNWHFRPNIGIFGPFDLVPDQKTMRTSCLGGFLLCWYQNFYLLP